MTGRRDPSARDAVEYAADAGLHHPSTLDVSPPCLHGTHHTCPIHGAHGAQCACYCHHPGAWGEIEPTRHDRPTTHPERHENRTNL